MYYADALEILTRTAHNFSLHQIQGKLHFLDKLHLLVLSGVDAQLAQSVIKLGSGQIAQPVADGSQKLLRSEEHTSELQSRGHLVCRLLLEKKTHSEAPCD